MPPSPSPSPSVRVELERLPAFKPDLYHRAWASTPHPTLPLLATAHDKSVTIFSLSTLSAHSTLTGGHTRSVRSAAWKPALAPNKLCLVTGSFDSTAGLWRWQNALPVEASVGGADTKADVEVDMAAASRHLQGSRQRRRRRRRRPQQQADHNNNDNDHDDGDDDHVDEATDDTQHDYDDGDDDDEWEFTLVLEGHENEIKSVAFSPSGQYLATCSRDKSVWIWEDVGATEGDDEWETVSVLTEHDGDVKCVAWCPDVPGRSLPGRYGTDVLASASYDDTVRIWREDNDGEWACVAVLEGHAATVWGVQWEPNPTGSRQGRFPRLLSWSADATIRIWTLLEEEDMEAPADQAKPGTGSTSMIQSGLGGIPNTMRQSPSEEWRCTAILPKVHSRDVYSASWNKSGLVASTGSDGVVAVYAEDGHGASKSTFPASFSTTSPHQDWRVLGSIADGHGPYEINHVTWCPRFDSGAESRGAEDMLVTTGDDGAVQPWRIRKVA